MTERVLPFDRSMTPQERGYWCGPASAQMALSARGIRVDEGTLAVECKTHTGGTDNVGLIERVLDVRLPGGRYTSVYPGGAKPGTAARPAAERKTEFWWNMVRSIDNGYAAVLNFVAPANNKPRGVKGSQNPAYSGGTTYHYVTCVGWSDEGRDGKLSLLIADSGFRPFVYWMDFEQAFSLIHTDLWKGYAYADLPVIAPAPAGSTVPPGIPVGHALQPTPPAPIPQPVVPAAPKPLTKLADPFTDTHWSPNRYHPRELGPPGWIAVHTQEGGRTARDLVVGFLALPSAKVSYHAAVDDISAWKVVAEGDAPWSASNANQYAFHVVAAGSYAGWSRDKWLETDIRDGKNEDAQLTRLAHVVAWWCQKYNIPAVWIGGGARPPWGLRGILGHVDLGQWGGGHTDPGSNFPVNEFMRRVQSFLTGVEQPPLVTLPPVAAPGTDPSRYAGVLLYRGRAANDQDLVRKVQRRLRDAYREYAGHLAVDGDFGEQTQLAVREFQRRSGLVADGIVGPNTAAALKAW